MKQRKYDQQQRNKYGDSRAPGHMGDGPSGRWGGPHEYERQPPQYSGKG